MVLVTLLNVMPRTSRAGSLDADLAALYHDTKRVGAYRGASSFIKSARLYKFIPRQKCQTVVTRKRRVYLTQTFHKGKRDIVIFRSEEHNV